MFTTHPAFKHRYQFGGETIVWRAVELGLSTPWYLATVVEPDEDAERTFLLQGCDEALTFASRANKWNLVSMRLVLSPNWSGHGDWKMIKIRRLDLQLSPPDGSTPSAVVTGIDGVVYGGFPIQPISGDPGPLETLCEFAVQ